MKDSFYYFFSATPQVLGGLLALFGVFVIFKVQTIRSELFSIGQVLLNILDLEIGPGVHRKDDSEERKALIILRNNIDRCLNNQDNYELLLLITKVTIPKLLENNKYNIYIMRYKRVFDLKHKLIKQTINSSVFTGSMVLICLFLIPFGKFILQFNCLLYFLFGITTLGIAISLFAFMRILVKSLKEPDYPTEYLTKDTILFNNTYLK